jgi:chemotaxis signal transduction protein
MDAMTTATDLELQSFVLLHLGERRFAVPAGQIAELVAPSRVFRFPHRSPVEGVILRRGRIVPICDVAEKLIGTSVLSRRFYLIAVRRYGAKSEWVALPVTGECELINAEMTLPGASDAIHVAGWISHQGDVIEILNIDALTSGPDEPRFRNASLPEHEAQP